LFAENQHFCPVKQSVITAALMQWHRRDNKRQMPWKGEKDPYKIWLSEVILQQTRVEQGWRYYENFIRHYPTVHHLAAAPDEAVFKLWEGLGYYNRCKNLLFTARTLVQQYQGHFPGSYEQIVALKGIGPYTAAAISSFAFNLPYAVLDGNVFRVLARLYAIDTPIDSVAGKKQFAQLAQDMLDKQEPGAFNQAMMDFGATICKPALPLCGHCSLQQHCAAYSQGRVNALPVKEKLLQKKTRWFTYFFIRVKNQVLVHKRTGKDIWENLYELYLLESDEKLVWDTAAVSEWLAEQFAVTRARVTQISPLIQQQLTHQHIKGQFIAVQLEKIPPALQHYQWQELSRLHELAFPKLINSYLREHASSPTLF
jgi:A/G-specific adenine glycosylase